MKPADSRRLALLLLFAPFVLWIGLLIVLPQLGILAISLHDDPQSYAISFANYIDFFHEPIYWHTLLRTAVMSILVTGLALLLGFPVAYYIAKIAHQRLRAGLFLLCLVPLWVSDLIRAFGWIILLRETGVVSAVLQATGITHGPARTSLQ